MLVAFAATALLIVAALAVDAGLRPPLWIYPLVFVPLTAVTLTALLRLYAMARVRRAWRRAAGEFA